MDFAGRVRTRGGRGWWGPTVHNTVRGDPTKAVIASEIRRRTAVPNAWISEALYLEHVTWVTHCARVRAKERLAKKLVAELNANVNL